MPITYYSAKDFIGGGADALDLFDGADLNDDDRAIVSNGGKFYFYRLEDSSGAAESSPDIISPDSNAGNKRWLLEGIYAATITASGDIITTEDLKIGDGKYIGSTSDPDAISISAAGEIVMNAQPAFLAISNANQDNIATGGVTVVFGNEIFDQGGDFASNTFTAPVAGRYQLSFCFAMNSVDTASQYYYGNIVTSNKIYSFSIRSDAFGADFNNWSIQGSILADMDASDTVTIQVNQQGGTAQTDLPSGQSYFSGALIC